ncbi:MAG TPA: PilZ domain-containing protein [Hyphomicrobiales bacterium]|nr:PilZ domain-containing protein [Hyphomicrobiales bacterium]
MLPLGKSVAQEKRRHQRVKVSLLGRYMLADRREFPCQTLDMSPGGVSLVAPVAGRPGDRVVAYLDHLGRVEGIITRVIPNGFSMSVAASARKRDKLAAQLTWLATRHVLGMPEDRRHDRIEPRNATTVLVIEDQEVVCRVLDVSLSGAAVAVEARPPIGSMVTVGRTAARVVRHIENGLAVEFTRPQNREDLEEQFGT